MNAKILSGDLGSEAAGGSSNWDHNVTESKGSQFRPGAPERGLGVSANRCWISVEKQSPKYLRNAVLQDPDMVPGRTRPIGITADPATGEGASFSHVRAICANLTWEGKSVGESLVILPMGFWYCTFTES